MCEVNFEAGSLEKFDKFVKGISSEDKVALISHVDLDGITSVKVVSSCLNIAVRKFVDYSDVDVKFIQKLKSGGITKIIFTDISITNKNILVEAEKFAEVLIIDHHQFKEDLNSDKTIFINVHGFCAAYLCYVLFSRVKNLDELDWLVAFACISDWEYFNNQEWMKKIYEKYGDRFEIAGDVIRKDGKMWDLHEVLAFTLVYFSGNLGKVYELIEENIEGVEKLKKYAVPVLIEIEGCIKEFDREKEVYGDFYFWEFRPKFSVKSIVCTLISVRENDKTFIFVTPNKKKVTISARRQDRKVDLPELLRKLIVGFENAGAGGHIPAAGGFFMKEDLPEFRKRVAELVR